MKILIACSPNDTVTLAKAVDLIAKADGLTVELEFAVCQTEAETRLPHADVAIIDVCRFGATLAYDAFALHSVAVIAIVTPYVPFIEMVTHPSLRLVTPGIESQAFRKALIDFCKAEYILPTAA